MKRLLLGLSVLSGVALVGVFAFAQWRGSGGGGGTNALTGAASTGQSAASADPWVQPMPQGMQANSASAGAPSTIGHAGDAPGSDPFAGLQSPGQRQASTGPSSRAPSQASPPATQGVTIRNVNSRQVVEEQSVGPGGLGNGADPFNVPPSKSQADASARGNETNVRSPTPLPAERDAALGAAPGSGPGNPLRNGQNADAGASTQFYDAAAARGGAPGSRIAAPNEFPAVADGRRPAVQEPAALPSVDSTRSALGRGPSGAPSQGFSASGAPPNSLEHGFGGHVSEGALLGTQRTPAPLGGSQGPRPLVGQLASATIRGEGLGLPGGKQLEGNQLPTLAIQKFAPPEVQVNKPAVFEIHIRNTGPVTAREVVIHDRVPQGTVFVRSSPDTAPTPQGDLEWRFDALPPREQRVIKVEVRPLKRGEIGSVATVRFSADASAAAAARALICKWKSLPRGRR